MLRGECLTFVSHYVLPTANCQLRTAYFFSGLICLSAPMGISAKTNRAELVA